MNIHDSLSSFTIDQLLNHPNYISSMYLSNYPLTNYLFNQSSLPFHLSIYLFIYWLSYRYSSYDRLFFVGVFGADLGFKLASISWIRVLRGAISFISTKSNSLQTKKEYIRDKLSPKDYLIIIIMIIVIDIDIDYDYDYDYN